MDTSEIKVFDNKTLSDIFKEIYTNSVDKREKIHSLIEDLRPFIKNIGDAAMLVPIIKEYMDVSVKNDEALIKMAQVVQRLVSASSKTDGGNDDGGLTEEEKRKLLEQAQQFYEDVTKEIK